MASGEGRPTTTLIFMSWLQKLILRFLPKETAAAAEAASRQWRVRCLTCGYWWDFFTGGGIRFGAASRGKRTLGKCPQCGRLRMCAVERIPPGETPPPFPPPTA
jgi:hypothetical protein